MKQTRRAAVLNTLFLYLGAAAGTSGTELRAEEGQAPATTDSLVGTWRQIKGNFNGKEFIPPKGGTLIKMHTAKYFAFIDADPSGKLVDLVGGTYVLAGNKYSTMPTFGFGGAFDRVGGKPQSFEARFEGDKWYHKGTLTGGLTIDEVWERVD